MNKVFSFLLREDLISQEVVDSMKSWDHSGFSVHVGEPVAADDKNARLFLSRYLKKPNLRAKSIEIDESRLEPTVWYRQPGADTAVEFSPLEFLLILSLHIPDTFEQTTRMYGCYSSSARGKLTREKRISILLGQCSGVEKCTNGDFSIENDSVTDEDEKRPASAVFCQMYEIGLRSRPANMHQMR